MLPAAGAARASVTPGYEIEEDRAAGMLRLRLFGLWDRALVESYRRDLLRAIDAVRHARSGAGVLIFVNLLDCPVQSQETIAVLRSVSEEIAPTVARTAVLVGSMLKSMQARRVSGSRDYMVSTQERALTEWLAADRG